MLKTRQKTFHIEILNKNPKLSKKINLQIMYLNKASESTSLPLKLDDILNPENDWLFDDTLKLQITALSVFKRINSFEKREMSPLLPQKLTDDIFGHRFLIPIYLFGQNKFENVIKFPQLCINNESHSICSIIFYYNGDDKIYIHTYFFFAFSSDNLVVNYENKDHNKI
ncbi:hypothetical protein M9Y10_035122 [Tritrichomonas musculus]|uniref:C2 NT-type domain-containing protein n=1 Tax=Tritrichomonas musculus TaxID=1915356 RepID=A0ABR2KGV3_9EUKA